LVYVGVVPLPGWRVRTPDDLSSPRFLGPVADHFSGILQKRKKPPRLITEGAFTRGCYCSSSYTSIPLAIASER